MVGGAAYEDGGAGVFQEESNLGRGVGRVQRDVDDARLETGQVQGECVGRLVDLGHQTVADGGAGCVQRSGELIRPIENVAERQAGATGNSEEWIRPHIGGAIEKELQQVHADAG